MDVNWGASSNLGRRTQQQDKFVVSKIDIKLGEDILKFHQGKQQEQLQHIGNKRQYEPSTGSSSTDSPQRLEDKTTNDTTANIGRHNDSEASSILEFVPVHLFAIFDGHGTYGTQVSEYVRDMFRVWFTTNKGLHEALIIDELNEYLKSIKSGTALNLDKSAKTPISEEDIEAFLVNKMKQHQLRSRQASEEAPSQSADYTHKDTTQSDTNSSPIISIGIDLVERIKLQFEHIQRSIERSDDMRPSASNQTASQQSSQFSSAPQEVYCSYSDDSGVYNTFSLVNDEIIPNATCSVDERKSILEPIVLADDVDPYLSGTTASLALYLPLTKRIILVTLGDSKCMVVANTIDLDETKYAQLGGSNGNPGTCSVCEDKRQLENFNAVYFDTYDLKSSDKIESLGDDQMDEQMDAMDVSTPVVQTANRLSTTSIDGVEVNIKYPTDSTGHRAKKTTQKKNTQTATVKESKPIKNIKRYYTESLDVPPEAIPKEGQTERPDDMTLMEIYENFGSVRKLRYLRHVSPNVSETNNWCNPDSIKESLLVFQTPDHSCSNAHEAQRIQSAGGTVTRLQGDHGDAFGPLRVFKGSLPYPGLAVTRTLGDTSSAKTGVLNIPEISVLSLSNIPRLQKVIILIGTDGIWDGTPVGTSVEKLSNELLSPKVRRNSIHELCFDHNQISTNIRDSITKQFGATVPASETYAKVNKCPYCDSGLDLESGEITEESTQRENKPFIDVKPSIRTAGILCNEHHTQLYGPPTGDGSNMSVDSIKDSTNDKTLCKCLSQLHRNFKLDKISENITVAAVASMDAQHLDDNVTNVLVSIDI